MFVFVCYVCLSVSMNDDSKHGTTPLVSQVTSQLVSSFKF